MHEFAQCGPVVLFATLLVIASAPDPVPAALGFQDCDVSNSAISAFANSLISPNGGERRFNPTDSMLDLDGTQDKVELYSVASVEKISLDPYDTAMNNYLDDTESVAWIEAQIATTEVYEDSKTEGQARTDARRATANYYAVKQENGIARRSVTVSAAEMSIEKHFESGPINSSTPVTKDDFA